jgi:predicted deacylase
MLRQGAVVPKAPVVHEDHEPGSGHMQACYPAPSAGLFEPSVRLGQRVEDGDAIGRLSDALTGEGLMIPATESGAVIVLRSYPRVDRGDSLAVILQGAGELPRYSAFDIRHQVLS